MNILLAITGASGSIYAKRLLFYFQKSQQVDSVAVVLSNNAYEIYKNETGTELNPSGKVSIYRNDQFEASFASGSGKCDAMVICPCSMGTLGRVASGTSETLILRAADVMLKERRRLVMVVRETPYNLIHIRNMETLTLAGAIICPATPSFYSNPQNINELADTVVLRVLDLLGIFHNGFRWGE